MRKQTKAPHRGGTVDRFTFSKSDPRWQKDPKGKTKVQIDRRFAGILNDPAFTSDTTVDKYGRKVKASSKQSYDKLFHLEDDHSTQTGDELDKGKVSAQITNKKQEREAEAEEHEDEEEEEEEETKEEEEDEEEEESDHLGNEAGEKDYQLIEEKSVEYGDASKRIAIQNCDWDNIKAVDLLVLLQSFAPPTGVIHSVTVYPSLFGLEREKEERAHGPRQIWAPNAAPDGAEFDPDRLRQYELDRLKYYYAVVVCDSVDTANAIYSSCDGMEFERSGNKLDLRFIPDDVEFEQPPRDVAAEVPSNYKPPNFYTKALQHSKVDLTWDSSDPRREEKILKTKFSTDELRMSDFRAYLASSESESSEDEWEEIVIDKNEGESKAKRMKKKRREKYVGLLEGMDKPDDEMQDMEITFTTGLSEKVGDLVEQAKRNKTNEDESVFHQQLRAIKEKKKKQNSSTGNDDGNDDDGIIGLLPRLDKSSRPVKKRQLDDKVQRKNLELLVMDENMTATKKSKAGTEDGGKDTKKSKRRTKKKQRQEHFDVDLDDTRFVGIIDSSDYAIDPTRQVANKSLNARLKSIQTERIKRLGQLARQGTEQEATLVPDARLSDLVESVKRKAAALRKVEPAQKRQRTGSST